jgi:hypothetical protein
MTPLGSFVSFFVSDSALDYALPILLALVIGLFLHLSTTILFEAGTSEHQISFKRILAILMGIFTAYLVI